MSLPGLLLAAGLAAPVAAETAILECVTSRSEAGGALRLEFRTSLVREWRLQKASLFLHVRNGPAPSRLEISAPGTKARVRTQPPVKGWVQVDLPEKLVRRLTAGALVIREGAGFDARQSINAAPYLYVVGR